MPIGPDEPVHWRPSSPVGDQGDSGSSAKVDLKGKGKALVQLETIDEEDEDNYWLLGTGQAVDGPTDKVNDDDDESTLIDDNEDPEFQSLTPLTQDPVHAYSPLE